jgi:hypothetical protein
VALKIFFCYAHEDEIYLKRLKAQLQPLRIHGLIDMWHDRDITPGVQWEDEISKRLEEAQIILLLISPDFMASDFCISKELKQAIAHHEAKQTCVVPIIIRPVHWEIPPLNKLQALPKDAEPVTEWRNIDSAFLNITLEIRRLVEGLATLDPNRATLSPQVELNVNVASPLPLSVVPHVSDVVKPLDAHGSFEKFVLESKHIFMAGVTLLTRTNMLKAIYKRMLRQGTDFQFIVLDPTSPVVPFIAMGQVVSTQNLVSEINGALDIFRELKDFSEKQKTPGKVEFIAFNYAPTLTLMRTENAYTSAVTIHVELPAYGSGIWERPAFRITQSDQVLFNYFERSCSELWKDAKDQQDGSKGIE